MRMRSAWPMCIGFVAGSRSRHRGAAGRGIVVLDSGSCPWAWCKNLRLHYALWRFGRWLLVCHDGQADGGIIAQSSDRFQRHVAGAPNRPFVILFKQDGADQAIDGFFVGKELCAMLLPLYTHASLLWIGQPLAYPTVQKTGAAAE